MKKLISFFALLSIILSTSCDKGTQGRKTFLQNVTGAAGEVIVVLSNEVVNESIGVTIKSILGDEYPMIPQSEPLFNAVVIPPSAFSDIFRNHRNIIIFKVGSEYEKAQIVPQRDVWAAPQTLLNIVGPTYPEIERLLLAEKDRLVQLLEQAERDRVVQNAIKFEAENVRSVLEKKFGVSMYFPRGYKVNLDSTDFVWITYDTPSVTQGILVYEYPYTEQNTFTSEYLIEQRNNFVNKYVPGPTAGSFMTTVSVIPPRFTPLMFKGRYFGQLRGLWDVYAHSMGGPFISLSTLDEANNRVITIEGFVYAPKHNKRNYVRQVEALLFTFNLLDSAVE
jgi:hypothetical protein